MCCNTSELSDLNHKESLELFVLSVLNKVKILCNILKHFINIILILNTSFVIAPTIYIFVNLHAMSQLSRSGRK